MKVAVINTGGTISCTGRPLAPMSAAAFADACAENLNPILQQQFPDLKMGYVTDLSFPESKTGTLDSTNLQPTDWCLIASYILEHYASYDGWVILHGTDSMDFTGAALPFLLTSFDARGVATAALSKPIAITGSQVPMFYRHPATQALSLNFNTDAFQNFCGAVAAAQTGLPEVGVYFHNSLFRGSRVVKTNASEFDAFSSPNFPALGEYGVALEIESDRVWPPPVSASVSLDNPGVLQGAQARIAYIAAHVNAFPVMQFNAFPAWYSSESPASGLLAQLIRACVGSGIKGLILESYGEGNFPSGNPDTPSEGAAYLALKAANDQDVVIVDCTQVIRGVVNDSAYAAGAWLSQVGALSPADMTPMAAFAKLMVLLASAGYVGWPLATVKTLLQTNLLGEMLDLNRLDSRRNGQLLAGQSLSTLDGSAMLRNDAGAGPLLEDASGKTLWAPLQSPSPDAMPGRLIVQNDGNLVFYSRDSAPMWATNTGIDSGASSLLVLGGSTSDGSLSLELYDYSRGRLSVLCPSPQGEPR